MVIFGAAGDLPFGSRRPETRLPRTVIGDCRAENYGPDVIAVRQGLAERAQNNYACPAAEERTPSIGIERAAMAVRRKNAVLLVQITRVLWHPDGHAASQSDVALPC